MPLNKDILEAIKEGPEALQKILPAINIEDLKAKSKSLLGSDSSYFDKASTQNNGTIILHI